MRRLEGKNFIDNFVPQSPFNFYPPISTQKESSILSKTKKASQIVCKKLNVSSCFFLFLTKDDKEREAYLFEIACTIADLEKEIADSLNKN